MICDISDNIEFEPLDFIDNEFVVRMTVLDAKRGYNGIEVIRKINRYDAISLIEHLSKEFKVDLKTL